MKSHQMKQKSDKLLRLYIFAYRNTYVGKQRPWRNNIWTTKVKVTTFKTNPKLTASWSSERWKTNPPASSSFQPTPPPSPTPLPALNGQPTFTHLPHPSRSRCRTRRSDAPCYETRRSHRLSDLDGIYPPIRPSPNHSKIVTKRNAM
jgi:hypothetical protein